MGLPCTMTWNFAMAKAFVNYQPYSLQLGTGITCSQLVDQLLCAFVFTAGFNPLLLYPQVLTCSSSPWLHFMLIGCMLFINIFGFIEQFYGSCFILSWLNAFILSCGQVIDKRLPGLTDIQKILDQYAQLKKSIQLFLFFLFPPLQIFVIFAFYVGTRGNSLKSLQGLLPI